jgi:transposase
LSSELFHECLSPITPKILAYAYSERLRALGLLTQGGKLRHADLGECIAARFSDEVLNRLEATREHVVTWMQSILGRQKLGHHPVKHVLLIGALYGDVQAFVSSLPQLEFNFAAALPTGNKRDIASEVINELGDGGMALSQVAKRLHISTTTCISYAMRAGLIVKQRPKHLVASRRLGVERLAMTGAPIADICAAFDVSVSSAYRVIKANPEVERKRMTRIEESNRARFRRVWASHLRLGSSLTSARRKTPAVYAWLYRHDREWLRKCATISDSK